eukprot:GEMP01011311.1.p1 GENE.GEMP01011311.1~~GEMP01011311.1.p1  ORF type:complete len:756 (+),score=160.49 GEMP01011311.1:25-2292(+)
MEELPLPGWDTLDFGLGVTELTVSKAVEEYLHYHGFIKSLSALKKELKTRKYHQRSQLVSFEACFAAFDEGNEQGFFDMWNRVVPCDLDQLHTLEVKLRVHFAIFHLRWNLRSNRHQDTICKLNFDSLREFLEAHPPRYRKQADSGSLAYYALVYVELPHLHPDFTHLFETQWVQQLRKDAADVVVHFFDQSNRKPMVYLLCEGDEQSNSRDSEKNNPVVRDMFNFVDQTLHSAENWIASESAEWKQSPAWLDRAKQRLDGYRRIALASRGESRVGSRQMSRASAFSRQSLYSRYGPRPTRSQGRASTAGATIKGRARRQTPLPTDALGPLPKTDFVKIAEILSKGPEDIQDLSSLFVSLLRHCSSVYEPLPQRRTFLHAICCFDIFNFELPTVNETLTVRMFSLDAAVALIAVIACEEKGRAYLQKQANIVVTGLMQHLNTKGNTELQAIVALQRLSLRRPLQLAMIEHGLIEWILKELYVETKQNAILSDITLEFGSALLMNLALRTLGKQRMEKTKALEVLVPLVEHPNAQVRTQANGTIYSLLSLPSSHETAKQLSLEEVLRRVMKNEDEIHVKQVEYLLDILAKGPKKVLEESEQEDGDDECFLEEEELSAWAIPAAPISANDLLVREQSFDIRSGSTNSGEQKFQEFMANSDQGINQNEQKFQEFISNSDQRTTRHEKKQPQKQQCMRAVSAGQENPRRQRQHGGQVATNLMKRKDKVSARSARTGAMNHSENPPQNLRGRQQRSRLEK